MANVRPRVINLLSVAVTLASACLPRSDLDAHATGTGKTVHTQATTGQGGATQPTDNLSDRGGTGGQTETSDAVTRTGGRSASGGTASSIDPSTSGGITAPRSSTAPAGGGPASGATTVTGSGGTHSAGGATSNVPSGGTSAATSVIASGGSPATTATTNSGGIAPDLEELTNSPVEGAISVSTANWDIYDVQQAAFRIQTPTATYFVVKSVAAIASLADENGVLWLNFSWSYVPNRGIPNLGGCCQLVPPSGSDQPEMTTTLDVQSETSTHVRLVSKPVGGDSYWLVWDFFLTHMTLTVNRAQDPYGFTFDGVPGNVLGDSDQLVLKTENRKANVTYYDDLQGPAEWVYLTNEGESNPGSLFLIQHGDDNLKERYSVTDASGSKGSRFVFGDGQISTTPLRFSLGLIGSVDAAAVGERVQYVISNTPP